MRFLPALIFIDDNRDMLDLYSEVAAGLGLASMAYANACFYVNDKSEANGDKLLVLDLCMPEKDGFEVIRFLKDATDKPDVVLVSGYDEVIIESAKKLAVAYGINVIDVLHKPVELSRLETLFNNYFSHSSRSLSV